MDDTSLLRPLVEDSAVIDVGAREIVRASGADRVAFLHRLLTGNVTGTGVGEGIRSLLLNLKGHIVSDMRLCVRPDEVWMVVAPGQGAPTATALASYAVMDDITTAVAAGLGPLALYGPKTAERLAAAGVALSEGWLGGPAWSHEDLAQADGAMAWAVRARGFGTDGIWLFADEAARSTLKAALAAAGG